MEKNQSCPVPVSEIWPEYATGEASDDNDAFNAHPVKDYESSDHFQRHFQRG